MEFCPNCNTKMIPLKKKQVKTVTLIMLCPKCGNEKTFTRPNTFITKVRIYPRENLVILGKKEQKYRRTPKFKVYCPKCGNDRAYGWVVHLGSLEQSSTQFYRCTKCNHTFRDIS